MSRYLFTFILIFIVNIFLGAMVSCSYAEDLDASRVNSSIRENNAVSIPLPDEAAVIGEQPEYAPGELLIKFKPDVLKYIPGGKEEILIKSESIKKLNAQFGLISIEKAGPKEIEIAIFKDCYKFIFPKEANILAVASQYAKDADVVYAEPNYIVSVMSSSEGNTVK